MNELDSFFEPKSVAIIGASRSEEKIGFIILKNFVKGQFMGKVYPVNPNAEDIMGLRVRKSVLDIEEDVELAVVAVPGPLVPKVIRECGKKKVKAVVVVSSGFSEIGNHALTKELQKAMDDYPKMRVVGPNCLGVFDSFTGVDTMFLPPHKMGRPGKGTLSFISQSGALGNAILDWDAAKGYGLNKFVSYGNAMDVTESDLLQYFAKDDATKCIAAYVEGAKDGKKFLEALAHASSKKPLIVIKGGLSEAGSKAVQSHTGSLAGSAQVYEAAFKQTNTIVARTMEEVFDYSRIFSNEPKPTGNRVQIITDGGGYGILASDALSEVGLPLAQMGARFKQAILKKVPPHVVVHNPIDVAGDANWQRFEVAIDNALRDPAVDMVFLIVLFQVPGLDETASTHIAEILKGRKKPVVALSVGGTYSTEHQKRLEKSGITTFTEPKSAAKALKALWDYYGKEKKRK